MPARRDDEVYLSPHAGYGGLSVDGYTNGTQLLVSAGVQTLADLKELLEYSKPFLKKLEIRQASKKVDEARAAYERALKELNDRTHTSDLHRT